MNKTKLFNALAAIALVACAPLLSGCDGGNFETDTDIVDGVESGIFYGVNGKFECIKSSSSKGKVKYEIGTIDVKNAALVVKEFCNISGYRADAKVDIEQSDGTEFHDVIVPVNQIKASWTKEQIRRQAIQLEPNITQKGDLSLGEIGVLKETINVDRADCSLLAGNQVRIVKLTKKYNEMIIDIVPTDLEWHCQATITPEEFKKKTTKPTVRGLAANL
jgi:hypothetical protein